MGQAGIPDEVAAFLAAHIDSIDQLEILLLLHLQASRRWSAADVARELRIAESAANDRLTNLVGDGVLAVDSGSARLYRYAPSTPELAQAVEGLEQAYRERRVAVITLIFSKPNEKIRTFADAFKFRKDK